MEMNMVNRLTGKFADVCDHAVAVCKALLLGKLRNHRVNMTDQRLIFFRYLGSGCKMLLRNHEKMRRRQRRNVQKREALIVLIDLRRRNLTGNDFTKQSD